MTILTINKSHNATNVSFSEFKMEVVLEDGRELIVPLEWFPKLRDASPEQLSKWRFIGNGEGIHWEELDEDVLVERLFD
jgi:hypothetical protein